MALNINTSRLNDALRQMASFFMQNKLGELSQQRQMDTYSEQDRLMRERSAAEEVAAQRGRQDQFKLDKDKAILNGLLKAAENPDIKGLGQKSETLKIAGRMAEAEAVDKELADRIEASVGAWVQTQTGEPLDTNQFRAMIMAGGLDKSLDASKEGGVNRRFAQELPIQEKQAATSAGNLALQKSKEARSLSGEIPQDEYAKVISTKVQKTMDNINSLMGILRGVSGAGNAYNVEEVIKSIEGSGANRLLGGAVSPQALAKMYSELSRYETKAMTGRLSPTEMRRLDDSLNVFGDYSIPRENEMSSQLGKDTAAAIEAENKVAPPVAPPVVAPNPMPVIRKYITDTRTNEQYWIVLRNGQWMRE